MASHGRWLLNLLLGMLDVMSLLLLEDMMMLQIVNVLSRRTVGMVANSI